MNTLIPVNNRVSNFKTYSKTYFRKFLELCLVVTLLLSIGFLASCKKKSSPSGLPPSAPTSLNATPGASNAAISWVNPTNAGYAGDGATPLEFKSISVIYTKSNSQTINTMGAAVETITLATNRTNVVISNLVPDTDYLYTVVVVNSIEEAAASDVEQFRTLSTPPLAPTGVTLTALSNASLKVDFAGGVGATSHTIRWRVKNGTYNTAKPVSGTSHTISSLIGLTEYEVEVIAINSLGAASATATGTTASAAVPPAILNEIILGSETTNSFAAGWNEPYLLGKNHQGVNYAVSDISYRVMISPSNTGVTASKSGITPRLYSFSGLSENTEYTVTVVPSNPDGGDGNTITGKKTTLSSSP